MDFIDQLNGLSSQISKQLDHIETEEATKNALIMPFINILGYNVFNPAEVVPEFTCDVGTKKGEKVDYAIMKDENPIILFECKSANSDLEKEHASQLYRYFSVTEVQVGVLTNGIVYKFYSDLEESNKMDAKPFLELDMLDIKEPLLEELKRFRKESFVIEEILSSASELKYTKEMKKILGEELNSPSEEFVRFFTKQVYSGKMTKRVKEDFKDITHRAFKQFVNEKISDRLKSALEQESDSGAQEIATLGGEDLEGAKDDGIVTTDEEMEGFHIVRAILHEITDPERITLKDRKNYCNVLLDNNVRKPICRFHFDSKQKYVGFFDENKVEEKVSIGRLTDIYNYAEKLKATFGYHGGNTSSKSPPEKLVGVLDEEK
ncbi:MAG: restriction endonuclease [Candidatus Methanogaster sp.]|uniref:Restriction endonuclease n=1 Tax=Candidatus Methanogaster sp. TaxID=3386292 RepID=A0AC61KZP7_9EURY|nr:MAG: restriction endonuclease [ANME-2 cluster archaeon]